MLLITVCKWCYKFIIIIIKASLFHDQYDVLFSRTLEFCSMPDSHPKSSSLNSFGHNTPWKSSRHFLASLRSWLVEVSALLFSHEARSLSDCRVTDPDRNRSSRSLFLWMLFQDPLWLPGWFGEILAGQLLLGRFTTVLKRTAYDSRCGWLRAAEMTSELLSTLIKIHVFFLISTEMFFYHGVRSWPNLCTEIWW